MTLSQFVFKGLPTFFKLAVLHAVSVTAMSNNLQERRLNVDANDGAASLMLAMRIWFACFSLFQQRLRQIYMLSNTRNDHVKEVECCCTGWHQTTTVMVKHK